MQTELRFQIAEDEEQQKIDSKIFPTLDSLKKKNLTFFQQFYPDLFRQLISQRFTEHSIFINNRGLLNVVELATGETLYPPNCVSAQLEHARHAQRVKYIPGQVTGSIDEVLYEQDGIISGAQPGSISKSLETLICLGVGLGAAIEDFALNTSYKNIVVMEPNWEYLLASLYSIDWLEVNRALNNKGGILAFDIEDASFAAYSLNTIFSQLSLSEADIYLHLHYPEYDALIKEVQNGTTGSELEDSVIQTSEEFYKHYHESPLFSHNVFNEFSQGNADNLDVEKLQFTFNKNLSAFEKFFPDIAGAMRYYKPQNWLLTVNRLGDYNLFNCERKTFWYSSPTSEDIITSVEKFRVSPVETVPSFNLKSGKLSHYTFYQYSKKIAETMNRYGKTRKVAPSEIPSLIFISLGIGRAHEEILQKYNIDYLYVIEPNLDFFFWSLHCVDWSLILESFNAGNKSLNFSLGDDGSHFIDDMKKSMRQVNGFFLLNSFLFIERQHKALSPYIVDFRKELINLITLSEHFHYARYTISHTYWNFASGHTSVNVKPISDGCLPRDMPIFVVGNGPSLDNEIEYLKSVQDEVIVVSCGTSLKSLWKNGITPDFHAEVEQNKCTYSIISQISDRSYLKRINYLAPVSTHPETAALFKHHYAMLTSFSGSMQFFANLKEKVGIEPVLPFLPVPTVTNFAVSSLLKLGFKRLVLIGVDFGFKDVNYHHSKDSLYYKGDGEELVSYEESMGEKLLVRGNFEPFVYTKPEFQLAAKNLGKSVLDTGDASVQNCSDGARIDGTLPTKTSDLEIPTGVSKVDCIHNVLKNSFSHKVTSQLSIELNNLYKSENFDEKFNSIMGLFDEVDGSFSSIKSVVESQKLELVRAYHEGYPFFYGLFVSTFNFAHASLFKVALSQKNEKTQVKIVEEVKGLLVEMLDKCFEEYKSEPLKLEETVDSELIVP